MGRVMIDRGILAGSPAILHIYFICKICIIGSIALPARLLAGTH